MKIAICDDDISQIKILKGYIEKLDIDDNNLQIYSFNNGESLYNNYTNQSNPFDIIFLDMQMPKVNGIETAVNIRNKDIGVIIIFITNFSQYVYDCFDAMPFRFLVKPVSFDNFSKVFNMALLKAKQGNSFFLISSKESKIRLNYNDILYFESLKRQVCAHTRDKEHLFYSKMVDLYNKISSTDFVFTHKSFIVNMNHIKMLLPDKIILDNDINIPLSKKNKVQVREKYFKFIERSYNI